MSERSRNPDPSRAFVREVEALLEERLGRFGLDRVEVRAGFDHAGEPAIFVDAWHRLSPKPVDPQALAEAHRALVDLLVEGHDERFPYERDHFDKRQRVRGFE